jgi:hypothetical protein
MSRTPIPPDFSNVVHAVFPAREQPDAGGRSDLPPHVDAADGAHAAAEAASGEASDAAAPAEEAPAVAGAPEQHRDAGDRGEGVEGARGDDPEAPYAVAPEERALPSGGAHEEDPEPAWNARAGGDGGDGPSEDGPSEDGPSGDAPSEDGPEHGHGVEDVALAPRLAAAADDALRMPSAAVNTAAKLAADANAAAQALDSLKRLLQQGLPERGQPPRLAAVAGRRREPTLGVLPSPSRPPPVPGPPRRQLPAPVQPAPPLPPAEPTRFDVRGFLAGFALSWAIGVVLYLFMAAG